MMADAKWYDREFERGVLNPAIVKDLTRIGLQGERISKQLIAGPGPLHAVDKARLLNSMAFEVDEGRLIVRIGTNVKYAIYVFLGTVKMQARPVLRTMLHMLKSESR